MKVLLLQGPMSPFFKLLADDLTATGASVSKINFNGGDEFYFNGPLAHSYQGTSENWKTYLRAFVLKHQISLIMGYGDCRFYHRVAKEIARELSITIYFFEEGYFRPYWITLERDGVNAHSPLQEKVLRPVWKQQERDVAKIPDHFMQRALLCCLYYLAARLKRSEYPFYQHHRVLSVSKEFFWWVRSGIRKYLVKLPDRSKWAQVQQTFPKRHYLVPLQIRDDAQLQFHSPFTSLDDFLAEVIGSFAQSAPQDTCLVIKHHPMDRGHTHYGKTIQRLAAESGVRDRVQYVHDIANPMLLRNALGIVTINSTMGISGLIHGRKVITLGRAMYHRPGLTFQGSLDQFWQSSFLPNDRAFRAFQQLVMNESQVSGSFYYPKFKFKLPARFYQDLLGRKRILRMPEPQHWDSLEQF